MLTDIRIFLMLTVFSVFKLHGEDIRRMTVHAVPAIDVRVYLECCGKRCTAAEEQRQRCMRLPGVPYYGGPQ